MHRRILMVLAAILLVVGMSFCQGTPASNDPIKKALTDIQFDTPIEITIIPNQYWGWQFPAMDLSILDVNMEDFLHLLVNNGYGIAGKDLAMTFKPTDKLRMIWREKKSWPNSVYQIPLAKRHLIKITYQNRWKENGIDQFSTVFSYKLEPILAGMRESEVLTGKVHSYLDPSDGEWKILEGRLNDNIATFIKTNLIEKVNSSIAAPAVKGGSKQGSPLKVPPQATDSSAGKAPGSPTSKTLNDPDTVLNEATELVKKGALDQANDKFQWCFENGQRLDPAWNGVRLSFLLSYWVDLGKTYPKAMEKIIEIRDKKAEEIKNGHYSADVFQELAALNDHLGEKQKTISLYKFIYEKNQIKLFCGQVFEIVCDDLMDMGEYEIVNRFLKSPVDWIDRYVELYKAEKGKVPDDFILENLKEAYGRLSKFLGNSGRESELTLVDQAIQKKLGPEIIRLIK